MRAAVGLAISVLVAAGCGGDLGGGSQGAAGATGAGATTGVAGTTGTTGDGGAGGTICDAPRLVLQSTDVQRGCGSDAGCHGAVSQESGLDLVSAGLIARLLDRVPDPATSVSCAASTMPYLISNSNPAQGLLIDKLSSAPSRGVPQPYPLGRLAADQQDCLLQWATAVTTGVISQ